MQFFASGEVANFDFVSEQKFPVFEEFGWIGRFMNAVEGGDLPTFQMGGNAFVGQEHEFFDELMGDVVGDFFEADGPTGGVAVDFDFGKVEVEGALLEASSAKGRGKFPGTVEEVVEVVSGRFLESGQGLVIGEAVFGVDD